MQLQPHLLRPPLSRFPGAPFHLLPFAAPKFQILHAQHRFILLYSSNLLSHVCPSCTSCSSIGLDPIWQLPWSITQGSCIYDSTTKP
jgi:hypothetical protein